MTALYKASNQAFYQFTHMDHSVTQVLYAMDMDLFKQAAIADGVMAATNQNPGIHSATPYSILSCATFISFLLWEISRYIW